MSHVVDRPPLMPSTSPHTEDMHQEVAGHHRTRVVGSPFLNPPLHASTVTAPNGLHGETLQPLHTTRTNCEGPVRNFAELRTCALLPCGSLLPATNAQFVATQENTNDAHSLEAPRNSGASSRLRDAFKSGGARRTGMVLQLRAQTWAADSHGLFDYETRNIYLKMFKCKCFRERYHIIRAGVDVHLLPAEDAEAFYNSEPDAKPLAQLLWVNGGYYIVPNGADATSVGHDKLWLVVRGLKDRGVAVVEGDVLKLGRYRLKVKEAVNSIQEHELKRSGGRYPSSGNNADGRRDSDDDCDTVAPPEPMDCVVVDGNTSVFENYGTATAELQHYTDSSRPVEAVNCCDGENISDGGISGQNDVTSHSGSRHNERSAVDQDQSETADVLLQTNGGSRTKSVPEMFGPQLDTFAPGLSEGKQRSPCRIGPRACRICLGEDDEETASNTAGDRRGEKRLSKYENPLISPCECKGSMKWVHLMCLRTWMAGRLNIRNDGSTVCFLWRSLECELCKLPYPSIIEIVDNAPSTLDSCNSSGGESRNGYNDEEERQRVSGFSKNFPSDMSVSGPTMYQATPRGTTGVTTDSEEPSVPFKDPSMYPIETERVSSKQHACSSTTRRVELFEIPRPAIPYAILEPRCPPGRGLHIVSLANNRSARLGRGNDSDIRLPDISVSRLHSLLRFQPPTGKKTAIFGSHGIMTPSKGFFVIEDNKSKFGTLLEIRKPFPLEFNGHPVSVQTGRTVLTFTLKRRWNFLIPPCFRYPTADISVVLQNPHQYPRNPRSCTQVPATAPTAEPESQGSSSSPIHETSRGAVENACVTSAALLLPVENTTESQSPDCSIAQPDHEPQYLPRIHNEQAQQDDQRPLYTDALRDRNQHVTSPEAVVQLLPMDTPFTNDNDTPALRHAASLTRSHISNQAVQVDGYRSEEPSPSHVTSAFRASSLLSHSSPDVPPAYGLGHAR